MSQRAAKRLRVAYESLPHPPPAAARRPLPVRPAPQSVYAAPAEPVLTSTSSSEAAPAPLPLTSDRDEPIQAPPPKPRRPFSLLGPNAFWRRSPRSVEQLRYEAEERARKGKWYPEPIKYLPGVDEPPTKDRDLLFEVPEPGSFQEMWEGQHINKAVKNNLSSTKEMLLKSGKYFTASPTLFRAEKAKYFPDIYVRDPIGMYRHSSDLLGGKVSLVTTFNLSGGHQYHHMRSWLRLTDRMVADSPSLVEHGANPNFQVIQLQHVSAATKLVRSLCWATLKPTYLPNGKEVVQLTAWEHIRRKGFCEGANMGFCYLVDWKQRIRWAGIGYATPAELEALDRCLEELLDRVQAGVKE